MKMCHDTAAASAEGRCTIVFSTATHGSVGGNPCGLVDTAATILVFVAMLSSLACAREPFKTKLIFSELHDSIYLVGPFGVEPKP